MPFAFAVNVGFNISIIKACIVEMVHILSLGRMCQHSYYKELVRKPGKLQRNKPRSKDLCWKVHDPAQSFVLCSHTLAELRNRHVSIG